MTSRLHEQLAQLIAQPSMACTLPALDQSNLPIISQLAEWFETAGFTCDIQPVSAGKVNLIARLGPADDASQPTGLTGLVLSGHSDTVPCNPELWTSDPFTLTARDSRYYGLGMADMKSYFALILEALRRIGPAALHAPLTVVATCDEETSMAGAQALLQQERRLGRYAVIGEPTSNRPARMHKGVMQERIYIEGKAGHSSDPALGNNALDAMNAAMNRLLAFRDELKLQENRLFSVPYPTLNLGCIHGGDNPNRICPQCELQFDLRPLPGMDMHALRREIADRLADIDQQFGVRLRYEPIHEGSPAMLTPQDSPLVQAIEQLSGMPAGAMPYGTEGPYFNQMGLDTVIWGPGHLAQAHQPDEYLDQQEMEIAINNLERLIRHYCLTPDGSAVKI